MERPSETRMALQGSVWEDALASQSAFLRVECAGGRCDLKLQVQRLFRGMAKLQEEAGCAYLRGSPGNYRLLAERLRKSEAVCTALLSKPFQSCTAAHVEWIGPELREQKSFVLKAVSIDACYLEHARPCDKDDVDVVKTALCAMKRPYGARDPLVFASERIKNDPEALRGILDVLPQRWGFALSFEGVPEAVRHDPAVSALIVKKVRNSLQHVDAVTRADKSSVHYAVQMRLENLQHAAPALLEDVGFLLDVARERKTIGAAIAGTFIARCCRGARRSDEDFNASLFAVSKELVTLAAMDQSLLGKSSFVVKVVKVDWRAYRHFKASPMGRCPEVVAAAMEACPQVEDLLRLLPADLRAAAAAKAAQRQEQSPPATSSSLRPPERKNIFGRTADGGVDDDVRLLACTVCFDMMSELNKARQCPNSHLLCSSCLDGLAERAGGKRPRLVAKSAVDSVLVPCPTCRERFPKKSYHRNLLAEQLAASIELPCSLGCGLLLRGAAALQTHAAEACSLRRVACVVAGRDCCSLPLAEMARHVRSDAHPTLALRTDAEIGVVLPSTPPSASLRWHKVALLPDSDGGGGSDRLFVSLCVEVKDLAQEERSKAFKIFFKRWQEPGCDDGLRPPVIDVMLKGSHGHRSSARLCEDSDSVLLCLPSSSSPKALVLERVGKV